MSDVNEPVVNEPVVNEPVVNEPVVNEYHKKLLNYGYDLTIISKIVLSILNIYYKEKHFSNLLDYEKSIYKRVHGYDFPRGDLGRGEVELELIYIFLTEIVIIEDVGNIYDINNIIFNLYINGYIGLKRNRLNLQIQDFCNFKTHYLPNIHIFYPTDIIFITESGIKYYDFLKTKSDSLKMNKINKKKDISIKENCIHIKGVSEGIKLTESEAIILEDLLLKKEVYIGDFRNISLSTAKKFSNKKLSKLGLSIKTKKDKFSEDTFLLLVKKDTKEILK